MKNRFKSLTGILAAMAMLAACNTLEVTLPKGPRGEQGIQGVSGKDGLSAYDIWVKCVKDQTIADWAGGTEVNDFFKYLKGKDGEDGKDGKSAFEQWREYVAVGVEDPKNPGTQWDKERITERDFYDFLSGADGDDGSTPYIGDNGNWWIVVDGEPEDLGVPAQGPKGDKGDPGIDGMDGIDGIDGVDGIDGLDGEIPNIGENGNWWIGDTDTGVPARGEKGDRGEPGEAGSDGKDGADGANGKDGRSGLSAYELWVADVTSEKGLVNPGNGVFDPEEYPIWPREAVSVEDFYHYLTGRDGKDGKDGKDGRDGENAVPSVYEADTLYTERVDGQKYNVAPVIALSKTKDGSRTYEYVNPFSGGAAFIVTGPGPVIIPDCEVTFTTMDGSRTYTKTSDASGYVYLTRSELPEWYEGAPSAADDSTNIASGVRPSSFSFGGRTVTAASEIAATCKVPYRVGLELNLVDGSLKERYSLVRYEVHRVVEGETEEDCFIASGPRGLVDDSRGFGYLHYVPSSYKYYRNEGAVKILREAYANSSSVRSGIPDSSSGDDELLCFFGTMANVSEAEVPGFIRMVGSESFGSPSFGDGEKPSIVSVYATFTSIDNGTLELLKHKPDYGLKVSDDVRSVHIPSITELPSTLKNTSYVWKSGHTTLTFELDWNAIGKLEVSDGYSGHWDGNDYVYDYIAFKDLTPRPTTSFSSFRAKGRFNGSNIDSKVTIDWGKRVVFTDIYDAFSVSIADVGSIFTLFDGIGGDFSYDASEDDENGNGTAYLFGQAIKKREEKTD
jgi:hypothetical protein